MILESRVSIKVLSVITLFLEKSDQPTYFSTKTKLSLSLPNKTEQSTCAQPLVTFLGGAISWLCYFRLRRVLGGPVINQASIYRHRCSAARPLYDRAVPLCTVRADHGIRLLIIWQGHKRLSGFKLVSFMTTRNSRESDRLKHSSYYTLTLGSYRWSKRRDFYQEKNVKQT